LNPAEYDSEIGLHMQTPFSGVFNKLINYYREGTQFDQNVQCYTGRHLAPETGFQRWKRCHRSEK